MTYQDVLDLIKAALTNRPQGAMVQVEDHEAAELALLQYIEQLKQQSSGSIVREAHAGATGGVNCNLVWNSAFTDTDYSFFVNGLDSFGNPVEIFLISKSTTKIVVRTLINATINAIAMPYGGITS